MQKYGWPVVLFVGIPLLATLSSAPTAYVYDLSTSSNSDSYELSLWLPGAGSLTKVVLLGILYPCLRNSDQAILRLAWSYTLVLACISTLLYFGAAFAGYGDSLGQIIEVHTLGALLSFLPLIWFARRASRASLTHAFFLVFIVGGLTLPDLPESVPWYFGRLWGLVAGILAAWLVANFDVRGLWFQRSAAVVVVILEVLGYLPLLLLPLLFWPESVVLLLLFPVQLVLIYLVRVRRPVAEA